MNQSLATKVVSKKLSGIVPSRPMAAMRRINRDAECPTEHCRTLLNAVGTV
jgi:hypothetical protein